RRKDNTVFPVHVTADYLEFEGREYIFAFAMDISKRKKAEIALLQSQRNFRLVTETIQDIFWMSNLGITEILYINPAYEKIWKEPCQALMQSPQSYLKVIHPEDREEYLNVIDKFHSKGKVYGCEYRILPKGCSERWIQERGFPVKNDQGDVFAMAGVCTDITGQKKADLALGKREAQYRAIFENAIEGIFQCTPEGCYININPALARIHGFDTPQACMQWVEMSSTQLYVDTAQLAQLLYQVKTEGIIKGFETEFYRKDKSIASVVINARAVSDDKGQLCSIEGSVEDITAHKRAEAEKEILESRLRQAQKMESIGTLAGGIAHDFNNILSIIIGYTELSQDQVEKGSVLEQNLHEIFVAGIRAKDLVSQILAFARKSDEDMKPIRPGIIIKEVLKFIRSSIPTTIEIQQHIASESLIMGNIIHIHQIIMNLCTNAAHAMKSQGGLLEVSLKDVTSECVNKSKQMQLNDGVYVEIIVSDNGTGIAPDIVEKIFEPYFTTKGPGDGTGMGLAMVHGIVEAYGGKITVNSILGEGSRFTIYLPVTETQSLPSPSISEVFSSSKTMGRILFVDDEATNTYMVGQMIRSLGYSVTFQTSSLAALELFRSNPADFDVVITDMTMPNMTGDNLAREMMKIRADIPIILCTGYSEKISDKTALEIGIRAFAYKPILKADLTKMLKKILNNAKNTKRKSTSLSDV
ncbi:MAG: PAS domain S-box protein, partial [Candidatus Electrothrix sp. ATG1]|nr:PAS domain S-box protein [Candidatus Electrothrix sp. ATG1]